jgi:signal transduction histidine kinase
LAAICAAVTVAVAVSPSLAVGYRAAALHVALETAGAVIAFLAAYLMLGRLRPDPRVDDLLLAGGLVVLAASNFLFRTVPAATNHRSDRAFVWAAVVGRLLGALLLTAAAFAPRLRLRGGNRTVAASAGSVIATVALAVLATLLAKPGFPVAVTPREASAARPDLTGNPVLLGVQLAAAVAYTAAAVGFLARFERIGDEFMRWLALGCVLAAFSRINYFLYPSVYTDWIYLGDVFRLLFFLVLLVGALRAIASYWQRLAEVAAFDERRRVARDLHDGLAQELAFIERNLDALETRDVETVERLRRAATRAREESRRAVRALSAPSDSSLDSLLAQVASDLSDRFGVEIDLQAEQVEAVSATRAEALARIAAEAITNAARHSGASRVRVTLHCQDGRCHLVIRDDGCGFDPSAATGGYGLISMRERAEAVGAAFALASSPAKGTRVEVEVL